MKKTVTTDLDFVKLFFSKKKKKKKTIPHITVFKISHIPSYTNKASFVCLNPGPGSRRQDEDNTLVKTNTVLYVLLCVCTIFVMLLSNSKFHTIVKYLPVLVDGQYLFIYFFTSPSLISLLQDRATLLDGLQL